ncbi:MAG: acyl-CoA dehydrogenase family protein [Bacteroidota bacterium]
MSQGLQPALQEFRTEFREWLEANCPQSMRQPPKAYTDLYWGGKGATFSSKDQQKWFEASLAKGIIVPEWPAEYGGGGYSKAETKIIRQEMKRINARVPLYSFGISMLGPALLQFASEEQKKHFIPQIVKGEIWWCQGYSEPNAGSDLASLATRAEDMGDHFIVNGQKVWTSFADQADWIFCLVRTEPEGPKHGGISFLLIDMEAEGVSTRPIKLISGKSPFCETFFDNVKVPKANLVGGFNKGWTIAKYLLTHERSMIGGLTDTQAAKPLYKKAVEQLGASNGHLNDPYLRKDIIEWEIDNAAYLLTLERAKDEAKAGHGIGAKSSFFKYYGTELNKQKLELEMSIGGSDALIWEGEASEEGRLPRYFCRTKANSIEGGTSEIQLNIISKRILNLPSLG